MPTLQEIPNLPPILSKNLPAGARLIRTNGPAPGRWLEYWYRHRHRKFPPPAADKPAYVLMQSLRIGEIPAVLDKIV